MSTVDGTSAHWLLISVRPQCGFIGVATLKIFAGADHSFHVPARTGRKEAEVLSEVMDTFADLVVFDPNDFRDKATYADPHQYPSGARTTVIVNGTVVVEDAKHTGATPGVVLRRGADGQVG
jgi:hypothetical protein